MNWDTVQSLYTVYLVNLPYTLIEFRDNYYITRSSGVKVEATIDSFRSDLRYYPVVLLLAPISTLLAKKILEALKLHSAKFKL